MQVPDGYDDYVRDRDSQFAGVEQMREGRRVTVDIRLRV